MTAILEQVVEDYLDKQVTQLGGFTRKCKWIGRKHAPDRVVFFRGAWFVELKRPGKKAEPGQAREHDRMTAHGARVCVLSTKDQVDEFILAIQGDHSKWGKILLQNRIKV